MRVLVDAQLPPALARWLADSGHDAEHVADVGMASTSDWEIWRYAEAEAAAIVTKDEDFARRRALAHAGPAVFWIRRGNTSRRVLLMWFAPLLPAVVKALERGETLVEVR